MVSLWTRWMIVLMILHPEGLELLPGTQSWDAFNKMTLILALSATTVPTFPPKVDHVSYFCPKFKLKDEIRFSGDLGDRFFKWTYLSKSHLSVYHVVSMTYVPPFVLISIFGLERSSAGDMKCVWRQLWAVARWFSCNSWLFASLVEVELFLGQEKWTLHFGTKTNKAAVVLVKAKAADPATAH